MSLRGPEMPVKFILEWGAGWAPARLEFGLTRHCFEVC